MNRRLRSPCRSPSSAKRGERLLRYLKPGALAQIRDFKVSARSQKPRLQIPVSYIHPSSPSPSDASPQAAVQMALADGFPCFSVAVCGPRFPQRKKLVAAKAMFLASSPVQDPVMDAFNSDLLVAH